MRNCLRYVELTHADWEIYFQYDPEKMTQWDLWEEKEKKSALSRLRRKIKKPPTFHRELLNLSRSQYSNLTPREKVERHAQHNLHFAKKGHAAVPDGWIDESIPHRSLFAWKSMTAGEQMQEKKNFVQEHPIEATSPPKQKFRRTNIRHKVQRLLSSVAEINEEYRITNEQSALSTFLIVAFVNEVQEASPEGGRVSKQLIKLPEREIVIVSPGDDNPNAKLIASTLLNPDSSENSNTSNSNSSNALCDVQILHNYSEVSEYIEAYNVPRRKKQKVDSSTTST